MPAQGCGKRGVHGLGVLPLRTEPGRRPADPQQLPSGEAGLFTAGRGDPAAKDPPTWAVSGLCWRRTSGGGESQAGVGAPGCCQGPGRKEAEAEGRASILMKGPRRSLARGGASVLWRQLRGTVFSARTLASRAYQQARGVGPVGEAGEGVRAGHRGLQVGAGGRWEAPQHDYQPWPPATSKLFLSLALRLWRFGAVAVRLSSVACLVEASAFPVSHLFP